MDLAKIVGTLAIAIGVVVAAGHAAGEDAGEPPARALAVPKKVADRDAERRAAMAEQQKRKEDVSRLCGKQNKTDAEMEACRVAYRKL
jgi:hypothetical protein